MKPKDYLYSIISGFLLMFSFPSIFILNLSGSTGILAFFSLVPFLIVLKNKTIKQSFLLGSITGFIYLGGAVYWLNNMRELGVLAFPCWLLLAFYLSLFIGFFAVITRKIGLAFAPFVWVGLEYLRTHLFGGFPWCLLGYSQFNCLQIIQISDITGVYGISFLLVLINTGIAFVFTSERPEKNKKFLPLAAGSILLAIFLIYGFLSLKKLGTGSGKKYNFRVVQAAIAQPEKWDPYYAETAFSKYEKLSENINNESQEIIVWPETATAMYVKYRPEYWARLVKLAKSSQADLFIGSPEAVPDKDLNVAEAYNSVIHFSKEGKVLGIYAKMHLVPFGEFVPFEKQLKFLEKFTTGFNKWNKGKTPVIFTTTNGLKVSSPVCWEVIFPSDCRRFVKLGARYLLTVSNDGWYGISAAPYQHFIVLPFRAVENRVSISRAANSALSGFIDYTGKIIGTLGQNEINTLSASLSDSGCGNTFYTEYGDLFSWICIFLVFIGIIYEFRAGKGKNVSR